jgi:aspartyl protease family protein
VSDGDQALRFLYLIGVLVLVASGLLVRRAPIGQTLKMVLAWVLIFAAGFAIFALRDDFRALGGRIMAEAAGEAGQDAKGGALRIRRSGDGQFWVNAEVNGRPARFMIDGVATRTLVSQDMADRLGIRRDRLGGVLVDTADGPAVLQRGHIATLSIGPITRRNLGVTISGPGSQMNVIGMDVLSSLDSWGVEGEFLMLRP